MIMLKVRKKKQGVTLFLEDKFFEKRQGVQTDPPSLLRVNRLTPKNRTSINTAIKNVRVKSKTRKSCLPFASPIKKLIWKFDIVPILNHWLKDQNQIFLLRSLLVTT